MNNEWILKIASNTIHLFYGNLYSIPADERWSDFVFEQASEWQQIMLAWTTGSGQGHPLLMIKYEDLIADTAAVLLRVLDFLDVPYKSSIVQTSQFRLELREEVPLSLVVYTNDERNYINSIIRSTIDTIRTSNAEFDMSEYLRL